MFKATIICVGRFKEQEYKVLEKEYLKRLRPYAKIGVVELPEVPYRADDQRDKSREKEAVSIFKHITNDSLVILLDEEGVERTSFEFAEFFERVSSLGRELVFIIGSGIGLHSSLKDRANHVLALSKLTFPHNIARILLEEQIYRAWTIMQGKQYHK